MNENELFVDNPLALAGLFGSGVYLAGTGKKAEEGSADLKKEILVLLHYPEYDKLPVKALEMLQKVMTAVKFNGKSLNTDDYVVLNPARTSGDLSVSELIKQVGAKKVLYWSDKWVLEQKEIPFYQNGVLENVEILRCHSLHTVMQDVERKKACWTAIRAFFGM